MTNRGNIINLNNLKNEGKKEEIALQFINLTELELNFYFETNKQNKIYIKKNEIKNFSKTDLSLAKGIDKKKQI